MRYKYCITILSVILVLTGCTKEDVLIKLHIGAEPETGVVETEPVITPDEFLTNAVRLYSEDIGVTIPGERLVIKYQKDQSVDYSVYTFDDGGFIHYYYYFAYDVEQHMENQTGRLGSFEYDEETALIDDDYNMVKFASKYIQTGSNSYNYFREVIMQQMVDQQTLTGGKVPKEFPLEVVYDDYTCSIIGDVSEYVPAPVELLADEEGYILCDNSDKNWTYIADGSGGIALTGYDCDVTGSKLIIPNEVDGRFVYAVRPLKPLSGVTCVEVEEGITELQGSFEGWVDLNRVILYNDLLVITDGTFDGTNLVGIEVPESVVQLPDGFFKNFHVGDVGKIPWNTDKLTGVYSGSDITSIIIPGKIKEICGLAFEDCRMLTQVFIEEGCMSIDENAFYNTPNLQAVVIPDTVTYIGPGAFGEKTVLIVPENSYAERYAEEYGYVYAYQQTQVNEAS